jgi:3-hydroxybutyryl-CoA dehydrogenase
MDADEVKKAGVVGCGIMGSGIVEVLGRSGIEVVVVDVSEGIVAQGLEAIGQSLSKAVKGGKLTEDERTEVLARVDGRTDLEALREVDVVIEAASEDKGLKLDLFRRLDEVTRPAVVLATNTSSLPIAEIGSVTGRPDKVVGMHFFNPPTVMALVEVVQGLSTSDETVRFTRALGERIGKTTVLSKDRAGFIVNLLLFPYLNNAVRMLEGGFAAREDIDEAIVLGLRHPMGPLAVLDLIGLDTALRISEVLFDEFKDRVYAPPTLLKRMVAAGHLGRKTGKGFYDYG